MVPKTAIGAKKSELAAMPCAAALRAEIPHQNVSSAGHTSEPDGHTSEPDGHTLKPRGHTLGPAGHTLETDGQYKPLVERNFSEVRPWLE
jgi:hypothetical protein